MAEPYIRSSPECRQIPVELAAEQPVAQWRGADGTLYTPGDVLEPDGHIVGAKPGELIAAGVVYIADTMLERARAFGWTGERASGASFVQVRR